MAEEGFRLPGSSYTELVKIIRAYGTTTGPVSPDDIAPACAVHPTQVSRNNAFLVSTGLIEGAKKKTVTERGKRLALALEHDIPDEIRARWRELAADVDFFQKILSAVRIRNGMEQGTLVSHIAYTAGQSKTGAGMAGAGAVLDILKAGDLVRESEGKLVVPPSEGSPQGTLPLGAERPHSAPVALTTATVPTMVIGAGVARATASIQIQVRVNVECAADELQRVGATLKALISDLSTESGSDESIEP